jgi:hypothetical protein
MSSGSVRFVSNADNPSYIRSDFVLARVSILVVRLRTSITHLGLKLILLLATSEYLNSRWMVLANSYAPFRVYVGRCRACDGLDSTEYRIKTFSFVLV